MDLRGLNGKTVAENYSLSGRCQQIATLKAAVMSCSTAV